MTRAPEPGAGGVAHLIHVGFPKTGSTFLQHWFEQHPQIGYCAGGIAGFYNAFEIVRQSVEKPSDLRVRVTSEESISVGFNRAGRPISDYDLSSDIDPAASADACSTLASLFPNATILLVTRGMREMLLSSYSQHLKTGWPEDFSAANALAKADRDFDLQGTLARYRDAFGANLIVLPYELLRDDPERFVDELERRLGLDHFPPAREKINPALSPAELRWYPKISRTVRRLPIGNRLRRALFERYVRQIGKHPLRLLVRTLQRVRPQPPLTLDALPHEMVAEIFTGRADLLKDDPLYAPYAREYYFTTGEAGG